MSSVSRTRSRESYKRTIINGIQCLGPKYLAAPEDTGCRVTKVTKNKLTAKFKSSGLAPMSLVKPVDWNQLDGKKEAEDS